MTVGLASTLNRSLGIVARLAGELEVGGIVSVAQRQGNDVIRDTIRADTPLIETIAAERFHGAEGAR